VDYSISRQAGSLLFLAAALASAQTAPPGRGIYESQCSNCHGGDGQGGLGPAIVNRMQARGDAQIATVIHDGIASAGMPAFKLGAQQTSDLIAYLRTMRPRRAREVQRKSVELTDGRSLEGQVIGQSSVDLNLRTPDNRVHLLRPAANGKYREVTSETEWSTYHGDYSGNRYTRLDQINKGNVGKLAPKWFFQMPGVSGNMETTPIVVGGIMYVTAANECWALNAGSGKVLWHFQQPRTRGLIGNGSQGFNRGVAVAGDRLFMVTDHAHLLALDRFTGAIVWDTAMANWRENYNATSAPLAVGNLVISGTAGGEQGARGFVAAFDQATGREAWRFWTVPKPGELGSETWKGKAIEHPSAVTWFTGTYDPQLGLLYWPTGNPGPDYNGEDRLGDNLYSDSVVALDAKTGALNWYYQFTPHDTHDWDATEPLVLIDAEWQGRPRKLLAQANRNGFFYVLDRTNGELLLAKPFVKKLNWAKEIGKDGRPVTQAFPKTADGQDLVCPSQDGAANWHSTAYNPELGLFYVQTLEKCNEYVSRPVEWEAGKGFGGGASLQVPGESAQKILRAIDIHTGSIAWEMPEVGAGDTWGGTLATSSGIVFVCEDSGMLMAVDAVNGKLLWQFQTNQTWKASPMTYVLDGKQYVAVAVGQTILAFGLMELL
jgi:alcohol dehydrogenase (cytochrome c)